MLVFGLGGLHGGVIWWRCDVMYLLDAWLDAWFDYIMQLLVDAVPCRVPLYPCLFCVVVFCCNVLLADLICLPPTDLALQYHPAVSKTLICLT